MPTYNDQQVVAALNHCLDLTKWNALPPDVRTRIGALIRSRRIDKVCFMDTEGFGLRVYIDNAELNIVCDGDESTVTVVPNMIGKVDLDGSWVRCPGRLWEDALVTNKEYIVVSANGRKFYDGDESGGIPSAFVSGRSGAKKFKDKLEAQAVAQRINGIVLEKE